MNSLRKNAEIFTQYTNKELRYPSDKYGTEHFKKAMAEINTLNYRLPLPLLLLITDKRPALLEKITLRLKNFLFRYVTIGGFKISSADQVIKNSMEALNASKSDEEIISAITHTDVEDERFIERFKAASFSDNSTAKYILCKIEENKETSIGKIINLPQVNLEHILPVDASKWNFLKGDSELNDRFLIERYTYSIGNMTILEQSINKKIKNDIFTKKIGYFEKSSLLVTKSIHENYQNSSVVDWTAEQIDKRTNEFAMLAKTIWPL